MGLVGLVVLAGCLGGSKGGAPPPATTGVVAGLVLTQEGLPLAGGTVRVLLHGLEAATGEDGAYRIEEVPVGAARLVALPPADGFLSQQRDVDVVGGVINLVDFELRPLPVEEPFRRTVPFDAAIECGLPGGTRCGTAEAAPTKHFAVEAGLRQVIVEVRWTPTVPGTVAQLAAELRAATPTACGLPYARTTGPSVLRFETSEGFPLHGGHQCLRISVPSDAAAAQQAFESVVTLFHHGPAPENYSAFAP